MRMYSRMCLRSLIFRWRVSTSRAYGLLWDGGVVIRVLQHLQWICICIFILHTYVSYVLST